METMLITAHLLMKLSRFVHVFGNYHRIFAQTLIILISKEAIAETKVKRTNERTKIIIIGHKISTHDFIRFGFGFASSSSIVYG